MNRFLKFYFPPVVWAGFIFYLSHTPNLQTPDLGFRFMDKLGHFGVYAILGYLIVRAITLNIPEKLTLHKFLLSAIIAILYGVSDEFHQYFVPGRFAEFGDFIADSLGAIAAIIIFSLIRKIGANKLSEQALKK